MAEALGTRGAVLFYRARLQGDGGGEGDKESNDERLVNKCNSML